MKIKLFGVVAAVSAMFATVVVATPVMAHQNVFQKAGKAVQYTTRKDTETISIDAHRAVHENSVHHVRNHHYKVIVTPAGDKVWLHHHYHKKHM